MSNPVITRNNLSKELSEQVFGKKSDNAGTKFYAPVLKDETFDTDVVWVGKDNIINGINKLLRGIFGVIMLDNLKRNNGQYNEDEFLSEAADFTAGSVGKSDIEDEIDSLQALQVSYTTENDNYGATDDKGVLTAEAEQLQALVKETSLKIRALRAKRDILEAEYARRAAVRAATKAAKEAAGGVAVPV